MVNPGIPPITKESTNMETKSKIIHGVAFDITQPYVEGAVITAAEARALNQVRSENIGNNVREKLKELLEAGDTAGATALVAERDSTYVFNMSSGSSAVKRDPIETEARKIAKELIKENLAASGRKLTVAPEGETEESWSEKIDGEIDRISALSDVLKVATKNVADKQKKSAALLESAGGVQL